MSTPGDVDGDGTDDLWIAARGDARGRHVWMLYGSRLTPTVTEPHVALTWSGTAESTPIYGFGADLDADDFGDVLLRGWADNDTDADYLAVVRGADLADHAGIIDIRHIAVATWDLPLHSGVYVLGDIDGDGFDDVAFGAPHAVHDRSRRQP